MRYPKLQCNTYPKNGKRIRVTFYLDGVEKPGFAQKLTIFLRALKITCHFSEILTLYLKATIPFRLPRAYGFWYVGCSYVFRSNGSWLHGANEIDFAKGIPLGTSGQWQCMQVGLSCYGGLGEHTEWKGSSNEFAVCIQDEVHEVFHHFHDDILIVSDKEKSVSSTAGHGLMDGNPYAKVGMGRQTNTCLCSNPS